MSSEASTSTPPAVVVSCKKWAPVGYWKFDLKSNANESCPICQTELSNKCIECQIEEGKKCGLSYGRCGHIYHVCCIAGWTQRAAGSTNKVTCPYCFEEWHLVREEIDHC